MRSWLQGLVPDTAIARRLVVLTFVQAIGTGSFLSVSAIYFVSIVGLPALQVGTGLSIAGFVGFLASVPSGLLADRVGAKGPLVAHYGALAVLLPLYAFASTLAQFLVLACLIGLVQVAGSPLRSALTFTLVTGTAAVTVRAQMRSSFNIGLALGTVLGGFALAAATQPAFLLILVGNGIAQAACALIVTRVPSTGRTGPRKLTPTRPMQTGRRAWRDGRFLAVTAFCGVLEIFDSVWTIAIPIWIVHHTSAPAWTTSVVLLTGSTLVIVLQVVAARRASTIRTAARSLRTSGLLLGAACLVFSISAGGSAVVSATILLGGALILAAGEITQSAGAWTLSFELPPAGRQGEYQGVFGLARGIQQSLGPIVVTITTIAFAELGWILLGVVFTCAGLGGWLTARRPHDFTAVSIEPHDG